MRSAAILAASLLSTSILVAGDAPPDLPAAPPPAVKHEPFNSLVPPVAIVLDEPEALADVTDLNVTLIERTPRYNYDATKNNPAPGDTVTFHGHIKHWGSTTLPEVTYRWQLDDVTVETSVLTNLAPGEERVVTWSWVWQAGNHWIKLTADPDDLIAEFSEVNNERRDRTNAIIAGFWVEQSVYNYFHLNQRKLGIGSNSWEDWIQRQMAKQNQLYEQAIWPNAPQGALDRVRIDKIVVVPDGALPLAGGLPSNNPDLRDKTVDLMWGFEADILSGTFYSNHTSVSETNPFYIEQSLIHELGHARYLIDCYGFDVHNTASHHSVQIWEGDVYVAGSAYMPFVAFNEVLYYNKSGGVMSGPYSFRWSPYETGALNLIAGRRALCGNYNAPCNIGVYLQDLPENNHLRIEDLTGRPRVNANVRIYRATGKSGVWYGKTYDNIPDAEYTTDSDGYIHLPRNPFNPGGSITHTYGLANGVIILRIQHAEQIWYRFVEASDFNLQYWAGNTQDAYYQLALDGPNDDLDGDGLPDTWEILHFGDTTHGPATDEEPDGLTNLEEYAAGTDPLDDDTDDDGLLDGEEVLTYETDPLDEDSDDDGLLDGEEIALGADPLSADTDGDGMPDGYEVEQGLQVLVNDAAADPDQDGFTNLEEFEAGSLPRVPWSIPQPPTAGYALSFDGVNDYLHCGNAVVSGSALTIEAWVYPQNVGSARILEKFEDYGIHVTAGNVIRFMNRHGFTWDILDGQTSLPAGEWVHVACVLDGTTKSIYLNGQPDNQREYAFDLKVTANPLIVGAASPNADTGYFAGRLDDLRVWNVARTPAEIAAHADRALDGTEPGLVAYWKLDEGAGQVAADALGSLDARLGASADPDSADPAWVTSEVAGVPGTEGAPQFGAVTYASPAGWAAPIEITVEISDAATGDDGVASATLYYGYSWPYNAASVAGAGPGGNGDGLWTFTLPSQGEAHRGQNLTFFLRAEDTIGRIAFDSNGDELYAVSLGIPGDADGDGDLDTADLASLVDCLSGPAQAVGPECEAADADQNGYIDLVDFADFQKYFSFAR